MRTIGYRYALYGLALATYLAALLVIDSFAARDGSLAASAVKSLKICQIEPAGDRAG